MAEELRAVAVDELVAEAFVESLDGESGALAQLTSSSEVRQRAQITPRLARSSGSRGTGTGQESHEPGILLAKAAPHLSR